MPIKEKTMDNLYGKLAAQVANEVIKSENTKLKSIDPITLMTIAKLIWEVIQCYMNKKLTEEDALKLAREPNFVQRGLLRVMVRKAMRKYNVEGVNKGVLREAITNELVEFGSKATIEDLRGLVIEFDNVKKVFSEQE